MHQVVLPHTLQSFPLSLPQISLLCLLASIWYCVYCCFFHPLAIYPGPWLAKLTHLWRLYHYFRGNLHLVDHSLFQYHASPVIRVGPNKLIFSTPEAFRAIHSTHPNIERGDFYTVLRFPDQTERSVFSAETNVLHKEKKRKLIASAFNANAVQSYEPVVEKYMEIWMRELEEEIARAEQQGLSSTIDISILSDALSIDCLFEVLTGEATIGAMEMRHTERFKQAMKIKVSTQRQGFGYGLAPNVSNFFELIRIPKLRFRNEYFDKNGDPIKRTLLFWSPLKRLESVLLPLQRQGPPIEEKKSSVLANMVAKGLHSDAEIMAEITNLHFAGTGTVAAALTSVLHDLASHPEWQQLIRDELSTATATNKATLTQETSPLNAFLSESLRLHPPGGSPFERTIFPGAEAAIPNCYGPLPPGTIVGSPIYSVNRDEKAFGPDAEDFRPQRWLDASQESLRPMKDSWAVFGRGSKSCPGHALAMSILRRAVQGVLCRWDVSAEGELKGRNNFEMTYEDTRLTFRVREKAGWI